MIAHKMKNAFKKILSALACALVLFCAPATADDTTPGIALYGSEVTDGGQLYLVVAARVENVSGLISARTDLEYNTDVLELVNTLDDTDINRPGRQNFLGSNVLSMSEIKEAGVAEYGVAKIWQNGQQPAGASGSGDIGLFVFHILKREECELTIRRDTLELLAGPDESIPEWSDDFRIQSWTFNKE